MIRVVLDMGNNQERSSAAQDGCPSCADAAPGKPERAARELTLRMKKNNFSCLPHPA